MARKRGVSSKKGSKSTMIRELPKAPTGIDGFDQITKGGLPKGRPTLIVGGPGSGKTLFAMEFLVNGANKFNEPGVFISFEESEKELGENVASLGFDLDRLVSRKMLVIDQVKVEAAEIIETGAYDLEGLFLRLGNAIDAINAKRIVLDTIESIFTAFGDTTIIRSEIQRLFRFLKDKGVTAVITGEKGDGVLTRNGLEEYVSDAVIVVDNRIVGNIATRRLRVLKYRGSSHGSNEYPFLIDDTGFTVLPISSIGLIASVSDERISTGIPDLDTMMGDKGYFKGSSVLITGQAGTGKTSFGVEFIRESCKNGKKALMITFEESPDQIIRNMRSIGIDLAPFVRKGLLRIHADRPTAYGLEMHLVTIHKIVNEFQPDVVVLDPINSLLGIGEEEEVKSTLLRMVDFLKMKGITSLYTDLKNSERPERSSLVSSLVDTWILLQDIESNGENNRLLRLVKSRGMAHSNQIREFNLTDHGITLIKPYIGPSGVMTGSARYTQEAKDKAEELAIEMEKNRLKLTIEQQHKILDAKVVVLTADFEDKKALLNSELNDLEKKKSTLETNRRYLKQVRTGKKEMKKNDR